METASPPSLRQFARTLLPGSEDSQPRGREVAAAFERACQSLHGALAPLISSAAVEALLGRALHLARREFPHARAAGGQASGSAAAAMSARSLRRSSLIATVALAASLSSITVLAEAAPAAPRPSSARGESACAA